MEGLEATEITLSNLRLDNWTFRLDSEFLKKEYQKNIQTIKSLSCGFFKLKESINFMSGGATPLGAEYSEIGIPFLRVQNIMQNYFNLNDVVYLNEKQDEEIKRSRLIEKDVLLTITGVSYGKSAVVSKELEKANINQHSVKITLKENINPYFLSTFFNCKYGKLQSDKNVVGVTRPALDYEVIRNFFIPKLKIEFQNIIESTINNAYKIELKSKTLYQQAEELLLETIGLKNYTPSQEKINIKSFKESFLKTGRLDAEYYQLKYEEIEKCIKNFKLGFTRVSYKFSLSKEISNRTEEFYNYTEISDVNISDGSINYNELSVDELPDNGKMVLREGQIIISKVRPYRGAIGIIRECPKNHIGSGAFTILNEISDYKKEVLQVLLRSKPYKELIMKDNVGSSYPVVKDENILNLIIPIIDFKTQEKIASLVQESFYLRKESERLLTEAKEMVEREIEDGIYN